MSDKSSIILRYDVSNDRLADRRCKGIICNHYRGLAPFDLVSRFAGGLAYFMNNRQYLRRICGPCEDDLTYQTFRRMFDVDFIHPSLWVSIDGVEKAKRRLLDGKISRDKLNDSIMWCDAGYGQLLIDIAETDGITTATYAFVESVYDYAKHYSVDDYILQKSITSKEDLTEAVNYIHDTASVMTLDEIKEFVETDLYDYAFFSESQQEETLHTKGTITDEDPIEELELSIRAYNSLKKAGAVTVGQLKQMSHDEIRNCRNMSAKACDEVTDKLKSLGTGIFP